MDTDLIRNLLVGLLIIPTVAANVVALLGRQRPLAVRWVSLAPRYIGRFEKGADYIGDLAAFEADFAIQQKPELLQVPGVEIVGFLPGELHMVTHFVAGIERQSVHTTLAKAFIDALRTRQAREAFTAKGLDPA